MTPDEKAKAKLEKLESKVDSAKKKLALERQKQQKADRKIETRKKILLGSYYLAEFKKDPELEKKVLAKMETFLTRDHDRAVFDLPPLPKEGGQ